MKKKRFITVFTAILLMLCLSGCGEQITEKVKEKAGDFLAEQGEKANYAICDSFETIEEYIKKSGAIGRKHYFENQEEAEKYLLAGLKERYGKEFIIISSDSYDEYGPIYGDVYVAKVAPADNTEQIFGGRTLQTGAVTDTYGEFIFWDVLTGEIEAVCESTPYLVDFTVKIECGYTEYAWTPQDDAQEFLEKSSGNVRVNARLENGKSAEEYTELILDFLERIYQCKSTDRLLLNVTDKDKNDLFFGYISVNTDSQQLTKEDILENIEELEITRPLKRKGETFSAYI